MIVHLDGQNFGNVRSLNRRGSVQADRCTLFVRCLSLGEPAYLVRKLLYRLLSRPDIVVCTNETLHEAEAFRTAPIKGPIPNLTVSVYALQEDSLLRITSVFGPRSGWYYDSAARRDRKMRQTSSVFDMSR
jgi:hypothetical protein